MNNEIKTIGSNIKKYRLEKRLTQQQLGDLLDVSQAMITQYESGVRKPKLETLSRLATALGVPYTALIGNSLRFDTTLSDCEINDILKKTENGEALTPKESALLRTHIQQGSARTSEVLGKFADNLQELHLLNPFYRLNPENKQKVIAYAKGLLDIQIAEDEIK